MSTIHLLLRAALLGTALVASGFAFAPTAHAQSPDIRSIAPVVTLLVDTSGSMQKLPNCACSTPTCDECLPNCALRERNRWSTVVEALTGQFDDYSCNHVDRSSAGFSNLEPDWRYYLPHIAFGGSACSDDADCPSGFSCSALGCQEDDGILDIYRDRVKFGLMTFDAVNAVVTRPALVRTIDWAWGTCDHTGCGNGRSEGGYSYGGVRPFMFEGCGTPYSLDNGSRNETVGIPGRLVSVGATRLAGSEEISDDYEAVNRDVQDALTDAGLRPYGATPVGGMLWDLEEYFQNHPDVREVTGGTGDPFHSCRARYAILLSDGRPNMDMREPPYNCAAMPPAPGSGMPNGCPYRRPAAEAQHLIDAGMLDGLYVVGFNVDSSSCPVGDTACIARADTAVDELNAIAFAGGTDNAIFVNSGTDDLRAALATILDATAPGTTTRTVPAVANVGIGSDGPQSQVRFKTGFTVNSRADDTVAWTGSLDLETVECQPDLTRQRNEIGDEIPPTDRDYRFHVRLNCVGDAPTPEGNCAPGTGGSPNTTPQNILTVPLPGASSPATARSSMAGPQRNELTSRSLPIPAAGLPDNPIVADLAPFSIANTNVSAGLMGVTTTRRQELINWVQGAPGSRREGNRFGSIVHSSPRIVGPPDIDIPDESYNAFRQRVEVANRPTVLYVGTNDGMLRAFSTSPTYDLPGAHPTDPGRRIERGEELFAFVPPMVLPDLNDLAFGAERYSVDGTPVVREMIYGREQGVATSVIDQNIYHTVLVSGMRAGGNGFFALDVTNPLRPEFIFQITDPKFGDTYGRPGLANIAVRIDGGNVHQRGIAILPGGRGELEDRDGDGSVPDACTVTPDSIPTDVEADGLLVSPRTTRRCWEDRGRTLVIADVATGAILRRWDEGTFSAPLTGGVAVYPAQTGTIADRAYFNDADGVLWRLDMSSPEPSDWEVKAMHDLYHDGAWNEGQPAYFPPLVSTTSSDDVVIIQATGNTDQFDDTNARNYIVSLTEDLQFASDGSLTGVESDLNWQLPLSAGEQVTGPVSIFDGKIYFGTFVSTSSPADACSIGFSRLFGLDYVEALTGSTDPAPGLTSAPTVAEPDIHYVEPTLPMPGVGLPPALARGNDEALLNRILMGVAVTELPNCVTGGDVSETDPYLASTRMTHRLTNNAQPQYELTALLSGGAGRGASVEEFTRQLPIPATVTRVTSYAGVAE